MSLINRKKALDELQKVRSSFKGSLSNMELGAYDGLLTAEDIIRTIPDATEDDGSDISYSRLFLLAKRMHRWIYYHSANEKREYQKIGLTDQENELLGYAGGLTISAIDGK